jgi:hypothetical protein
MTNQFISATERIYRELSQPKAQEPKPASVTAEPKQITLTRADVEAILRRKRSATPDELQYAIDHANEFKLADYQRNQLGVDLSLVIAQRSRGMNGRREDPNAQFIAQFLGYLETPVGLIDRSFVENTLRVGSENIQRCRNHRPPRCSCWSAQRAILWEASAHGEKSPEGWAAVRLYEALEELETASRPEPRVMPTPEIIPENEYLAARRNPYEH